MKIETYDQLYFFFKIIGSGTLLFPLPLKFIQKCSFIHYDKISNTFLSMSLIYWKSGVEFIKCLSE